MCTNTSEYITHHVAIMRALCNMHKLLLPAMEYGMCTHLIHAPVFSLVFCTKVVNVQHYYCFFFLETFLQGLSDPEESVICGTIHAMTLLCERGLFDLRLMVSALKQIVPYLVHPVS